MATARAAPSSGSVAEPSSSSRTRESSGGFAGDAVEVDDVGGEAGEVALDRLSVADVGVDAGEEGKLCFFGGNGNAGLRHEGEQAEGLERDGLAAGVGAADDELSCFGRKDDGERDGSFGFFACFARAVGSHAEFEERMAGGGEGELLRKGGADAVEGDGEAGAGEVGFDLGEDAGAEVDRRGVFAEGAGHGDEDAVNLGLLFVEEADEFVVLLDGFEGFDEDGLAGGRRAVDDAGDLAFELGFDRDDEAVAADGDEVFLGAAAFAQAAQGFAEALFDGAVLAFHRAADAAEFGGGVVVEAAVGFDLAAQKAEEWSEVVVEERRGEVGDAGPLVAGAVGRRVDEVAPCGDAFDDGEEVADLGGFEGGTVDAGLVEEDGGVEEAAELEAAAAGEHGAHLGGALLLLVDPGEVGSRVRVRVSRRGPEAKKCGRRCGRGGAATPGLRRWIRAAARE